MRSISHLLETLELVRPNWAVDFSAENGYPKLTFFFYHVPTWRKKDDDLIETKDMHFKTLEDCAKYISHLIVMYAPRSSFGVFRHSDVRALQHVLPAN